MDIFFEQFRENFIRKGVGGTWSWKSERVTSFVRCIHIRLRGVGGVNEVVMNICTYFLHGRRPLKIGGGLNTYIRPLLKKSRNMATTGSVSD